MGWKEEMIEMEEKPTVVLDREENEAEEIILGKSKIQKDGSFTIPKKVREFLGVCSGDKVTLEYTDNKEMIMEKA